MVRHYFMLEGFFSFNWDPPEWTSVSFWPLIPLATLKLGFDKIPARVDPLPIFRGR